MKASAKHRESGLDILNELLDYEGMGEVDCGA